jgi:putative chitinase
MKYFTMDEFIRSEKADELGIDNTPTEYQKNNVIEMVDNLLDPLREAWAVECNKYKLGTAAIRVSSGIRSHALNEAVGGSKTSAHYHGYAADLVPCNGNLRHFKKFCINWLLDKDFDQMISENEDKNNIPEWIHIGYKNGVGKQRQQFKYMVNGKYYYLSQQISGNYL